MQPTALEYALFYVSVFLSVVVIFLIGRLVGKKYALKPRRVLSREQFWRHMLTIIITLLIALTLLGYASWNADLDRLASGMRWLKRIDNPDVSKHNIGSLVIACIILYAGIFSVQWQDRRIQKKTKK